MFRLIFMFELTVVFSLYTNCLYAGENKQVVNIKALKEYYNKYNNKVYPEWFKKVLRDKKISIIQKEEGDPIELNLQNLLIRSNNNNIIKKSYQESLLRDLYIMFFEGVQKYMQMYFSVLNDIESQAFLSLVISDQRKHELILNKQVNIDKNIKELLLQCDFYYGKISQILEVLADEKYMLHSLKIDNNINKISTYLVSFVDPADYRTYILAIKGGDRTLVGHRMEIYKQLKHLAGLSLREVALVSGKDAFYSEYDWDEIARSYSNIKKNLNELIEDDLFGKLSEKEKKGLNYIIKTELNDIKEYFENLGYPPLDNSLR